MFIDSTVHQEDQTTYLSEDVCVLVLTMVDDTGRLTILIGIDWIELKAHGGEGGHTSISLTRMLVREQISTTPKK